MKKLLTIIFDGFGIRDEEKGNAIKAANMQNFKNLWENYPHAILGASEEAVGLKSGQVGNSDVGHLTIGAGKVLKQREILADEFFENIDMENPSIIRLLENKEKTVHIIGLCSDGGVHSSIEHMLKMHSFLCSQSFNKIFFHLMTDGRDTETTVAYEYIKRIEEAIRDKGIGEISTVCGRYYGMDRDQNWERTKAYYDLIVNGKGFRSLNIERTLNSSYANNVTDEFIKPILLSNKTIKNGDVVIWMNYRNERAKQILTTLTSSSFDKFPIQDLTGIKLFTLFDVDKKVKSFSFLQSSSVDQPLGMYLSELGLTQARVAESEKFPHVTYFFDGGYEGKVDKCDKFNIPSPEVATYDLKPEMSAVAVTKKVIACMENDYDFILVNYANPDMVGHTGNMEAATKACMALDICLGKLLEKAEDNFYKVILLADHGNADIMINEDGSPCTTHTITKVPFIVVDSKVSLVPEGTLANVAPTILDYLDIAIPKDMQETDSLLIDED